MHGWRSAKTEPRTEGTGRARGAGVGLMLRASDQGDPVPLAGPLAAAETLGGCPQTVVADKG